MTLTVDLPIFKQTYELVSLLLDYVVILPKLYKHTLGSRLVDTSTSLFEYISLANRSAKDRQIREKYLSGFLVKFESLKILIRLCTEKKIFSTKQAARLALLTSSIGKQATAWKNK